MTNRSSPFGAALLGLALALAPLSGAVAQGTGTVAGTVRNAATNAPIPGVRVQVRGTNQGAITAQDGSYRFNVAAGSHTLVATRVGFDGATAQVAVTAGQRAEANFTLRESAVAIAGVVATATGREQRTREVGNAVGSITPEDVDLAPVDNITSLLQGRSPGVFVAQNSGTTGVASRIRIRGSNSVSLSNEPLVIIDGVRINSQDTYTNVPLWQSPNRLNDINPEDIENIEILKGPAAAALYGTAAANGVIQVTTKRGRAGATRWNAFTEQGQIREVTDYPASFRSDGCILLDIAEGDCDEIEGLISFNPLETPGFSPFRDGSRQQYGLGVSGGTEAVTYYLAGEWEDETGVYEVNALNRYSARANLTSRVSEKLNLTLKTGYVSSDLRLPDNDNSLYGFLLNGLLGSGDSAVARGTYGIPTEETNAFETGQLARRFTTSLNANFRPTSWLSIVGTAGLDQVNRHDHDYVGANEVSDVYSALIPEGYRRSNRVEITNFTSTLDGTFTFPLREEVVSNTSVGVQYHREDYHDTRAFGRGIAPGTKSLQGTSKLFAVSENTVENATVGTYLSQQVAFNDRLFVTGSLRGDDNSAFGTATEFVWYPSFSTSWVVSEEPFFPSVPALSNLRFRAAYGKSGLRPSFRDALTYYAPVAVRLGAADVAGVTVSGTGNVDLKPEIATEVELGFDAGLLDDRLGFELTWYNKRSDDALVQRVLPPSLGLTTSRWDNVGSVRNRGWEALLNARLADTRVLQWDATLTAARNSNKLISLAEGIEPILLGSNRNQQKHIPGYPLGGYWQRPITYADANGDGMLQVSEVSIGDTAVYLGQPIPTREGSLSSSLTLFGWLRVSGLLDYKGGHQLLNFTRFDRCSWEIVCEASYVRERSNLQDQAGIIAYNVLESGINTAVYIEDADYVKLREVAVSLMVPERYTERFSVNGLRLTLSGRNLKTWTDYSGFDPETNGFGIANFQTYDYYTQPSLRYWTARVDFNF